MNRRKQFQITLGIEVGNALEFQADVLALKYAQTFHGVDREVGKCLSIEEDDLNSSLSNIHDFCLLPTKGSIAAKAVLFVCVQPLRHFGYQEIESLGGRFSFL